MCIVTLISKEVTFYKILTVHVIWNLVRVSTGILRVVNGKNRLRQPRTGSMGSDSSTLEGGQPTIPVGLK